MKLFNLVFALSTVLVTSVGFAQAITSANSSGSGGLVPATKDWNGEIAASRFYDGQFRDQSAALNQLGCFPTGAQVTQATSDQWWALAQNFGGSVPGNEWYLYLSNFAGTLAPGQSFKATFRVCAGAGEQPFPQADIFYQKISGTKRLIGYLVNPVGQRISLAEASSTGGNYNAVLGGAQAADAMPGVWTLVLTNTTRKPLEVYMASFKMYLL